MMIVLTRPDGSAVAIALSKIDAIQPSMGDGTTTVLVGTRAWNVSGKFEDILREINAAATAWELVLMHSPERRRKRSSG